MAKKRRRRIPREDLTEEEIRRMRRRRKQRKIRVLKRRIYAVLFLVLAIIVVIFIFRHRHKTDEKSSVSENGGLPTSGAADPYDNILSNDVYDDGYGDVEAADTDTSSEYYQYNGVSVMTPNEPLNVTTGRAAVDFTAVSDNAIGRVQAAKGAMMQMAYFTGTSRTVNDFLSSYGPGTWHAIQDIQGDICAFYEGVHTEYVAVNDDATGETVNKATEVPFKVTFIIYEDGTFMVQGAENNGSRVDDYETFLKGFVFK